MNEKVDVQIGTRRLVVEIEGLTPLEINNLARKVSEITTGNGTPRYRNAMRGEPGSPPQLPLISFRTTQQSERRT